MSAGYGCGRYPLGLPQFHIQLQKGYGMEFKKKRVISLIAGVIIELLSGIAYAWSVFQAPLMEKFGWSVSQVTLGYTIYFLGIMVVSMLFGAKLRQKLSIKNEVLLGAVLYGGGILLMAFMRGNIWELYLFFGILSAIGTAMIYPVLISYALELFPEKTGFAGGLMTAGYGLGAVIWAPFTGVITEKSGDINRAFLIMGILFTVGIIVLAQLLYTVPDGFREQILGERSNVQKSGKKPVVSVYDVGKKEMVKLPAFYVLFISLLIGLACGSMIITQGAPILQLMFEMPATVTAMIVSLLAVTNTIGRLAWGAFSDRFGKTRTLLLVHICTAVCMFLLVIIRQPAVFIGVLLGTTFCYGGVACLVAPSTEEMFGGAHISENYSITYGTFGLSSLIGPLLIARIRESTGMYVSGFSTAGIMALAGCVLTVVLILSTQKMTARKKAEVKTLAKGSA